MVLALAGTCLVWPLRSPFSPLCPFPFECPFPFVCPFPFTWPFPLVRCPLQLTCPLPLACPFPFSTGAISLRFTHVPFNFKDSSDASRILTTSNPNRPLVTGSLPLRMQSIKCWHSSFSGSSCLIYGTYASP